MEEQSLCRSIIFSAWERCEVLQATATIFRYLNFAAEKHEFDVFEHVLVGRCPLLDNPLSLVIRAPVPGLPGIRWRLNGKSEGKALAIYVDEGQAILMRQVVLVKSGLNGIDLPGRHAGVTLVAHEALAENVRGVRLPLGRPVLAFFRVAQLDLERLVVLHREASVVLLHVVEVVLRPQAYGPHSFGDLRSGRQRRHGGEWEHLIGGVRVVVV